MALSVLYGLPKPLTSSKEKPPEPALAPAPDPGPYQAPASGSSPEQNNDRREVQASKAPVLDGPLIEEYGGESEIRRNHGLKGGPNPPLGRDDEITILKDSLSRKDAELKQVERKLQALHGAYIDLSEKYFVSVAVFAKMNAATEGYFCNLDVYHLYAEAVRQRIQPENWAQWITEEIQKNSSKA